MVNFLTKFLSGKTDGSISENTETERGKDVLDVLGNGGPLLDAAAIEAALPPAPAPTPASERPMYYTDPHSGMPMHAAPDMGELEEFEATAGETLLPGTQAADEDAVIEALRTVYDPEIPVNIYDLGLIYTIDIKGSGDVNVEMSLTAPGCPVAGEMPGMVSDAVAQVDGVGICTTKLVWEPMWTMDRMSEDAKLALGMF